MRFSTPSISEHLSINWSSDECRLKPRHAAFEGAENYFTEEYCKEMQRIAEASDIKAYVFGTGWPGISSKPAARLVAGDARRRRFRRHHQHELRIRLNARVGHDTHFVNFI